MTDQLDRLKAALADRYAIERELGAGGMATVYLAQDVRHERQVAIKVLRSDLAATLGAERFHREIKIAAQLQHPHILPLLDSGEADGLLYYVMPYIEGHSLRDKLETEGELPIAEVVRILRDVVDALTAAHAHRVVHRDIKPENILLSGRHALVTDFGVAKAVSEATGREQLTTAGIALGTPSYMAPEQASADPHLDHRVDIYAVGAVAYELLTGRPVFMGTTPQMVLAAHVTEAPQPVTKRRQSVPASFNTLVMRCLEKKPADRWQSAEELLPQLEALATPSGGMTPTDTLPISAARPARRNLFVAGGAAIAALVLVVTSLWVISSRWGGAGEPVSERIPMAVLVFDARDSSADAESFSEGIAEDVGTQLSKMSGFAVKAHASARRLSPDTMSYAAIAQRLQVDYLVHGNWSRAGEDVRITVRLIDPATEEQRWAENYTLVWTAASIFDVRNDVAEQIASALDLTLSPAEETQLAARPTESTNAYDAYRLGRFHWARRTKEDLHQAIEHFTAAAEADSTYALAYAGLADAYAFLPWYGSEQPEQWYPQAKAAAERALAIDNTLAEAHTSLAAVHWWYEWDWDAAGEEFQRALEFNPNYATALHWHGAYLAGIGRLSEGIAELTRAAEIDPLARNTRLNLGDAMKMAGRNDEAFEQYRYVDQLYPGRAAKYLGRLHLNLGQLEEALAAFGQDTVLSSNDCLGCGRAAVLTALGDSEGAHQILEELLRQSRREYVSPVFFAEMYLGLGDLDEVFAWLGRAVDERDPRLAFTLLVQPRWAPMLADPRFSTVLRKMGLGVDEEGRVAKRD